MFQFFPPSLVNHSHIHKSIAKGVQFFKAVNCAEREEDQLRRTEGKNFVNQAV